MCVSSFIRTITVGTGIAPVRHSIGVLADCYRRWGVAPRLEDGIFIILQIGILSIGLGQIIVIGDGHFVASFVLRVPLMPLHPYKLYLVTFQEGEELFP